MRELSLYSGAGGGLIATRFMLNWRVVGYVEVDYYCREIIAQRIRDGLLDYAPIFGDIREFISEGFARGYKGMVEVITAGFPCQPFSVAGRREGERDDRNLWPETIETIRLVRPEFFMLENVYGLLNTEYFGTILGEISEAGYNARWEVISAEEVGAPHGRPRIWIYGVNKSGNTRRRTSKTSLRRRRRISSRT